MERVDCHEWGGSVWCKPMTARQRLRVEEVGDEVGWAYVIVFSMCDESGRLILDEWDVVPLLGKNGDAVHRVLHAALRANRMARGDMQRRIQDMHNRPILQFSHELAMRLGKTVAEVLDGMDAPELSDWLAFDAVHVSESWYQTACLRWDMIHAFGKPKKALKFEKLLPPRSRRRPTEAEEAERQRREIENLEAVFGTRGKGA